MSPPQPQVDTFLNLERKPTIVIDKVSKTFIIAGWILGINRVSVMGATKGLYIFFIFGLPMILRLILFYVVFQSFPILIFQLFTAWNFFEFIVCTISPYILHKNLFNFYLVVNRFDQKTGFQKRKIRNRNFIYNYLQSFLTIVLIAVYNLRRINEHDRIDENYLRTFLWFMSELNHCVELHYDAHLFILIIPRLKHLNWCIELFYPKTTYNDKKILRNDRKQNVKVFSHIHIKELLEFYKELTIGFDYLYATIRWQVITHISTTFSSIMSMGYFIMKSIIFEDNTNLRLESNIIISLIQLGPVLALCAYAQQVRDTVRLLNENLTSRIYQNTLDKSNRSAARAFLMLLEKCDMSFCPFHMFHIDITLPFKLGVLLLTYLVILLQFDKLLNSTH